MRRRRFIAISGAALALPRWAQAETTSWAGYAMGAEVRIEVTGPGTVLAPAVSGAVALLRRIEAMFSLYDPGSLLVRLNRDGVVPAPPDDVLAVCALTARVHGLTRGQFDPTVQRYFRDVTAMRQPAGWDAVRYGRRAIMLEPGQALTFNGIAQGYATDRVMDMLRRAGIEDLHVNLGEHAVHGRPRRFGIEDARHGLVGTMTLRNAAVATSSAAATLVGGRSHLVSPRGAPPLWSSVTVEAGSAALADGLSTGLAHCEAGIARDVARSVPDVRRIYLTDHVGDVRRVTA